jgi:hypothetical protein
MSNKQDKVKVTFECTSEERAYIKMLAARSHTTLNEFIISCLRGYFPHQPNEETLEAMQELEAGGGILCESLDDFWKKMGMNPQ